MAEQRFDHIIVLISWNWLLDIHLLADLTWKIEFSHFFCLGCAHFLVLIVWHLVTRVHEFKVRWDQRTDSIDWFFRMGRTNHFLGVWTQKARWLHVIKLWMNVLRHMEIWVHHIYVLEVLYNLCNIILLIVSHHIPWMRNCLLLFVYMITALLFVRKHQTICQTKLLLELEIGLLRFINVFLIRAKRVVLKRCIYLVIAFMWSVLLLYHHVSGSIMTLNNTSLMMWRLLLLHDCILLLELLPGKWILNLTTATTLMLFGATIIWWVVRYFLQNVVGLCQSIYRLEWLSVLIILMWSKHLFMGSIITLNYFLERIDHLLLLPVLRLSLGGFVDLNVFLIGI